MFSQFFDHNYQDYQKSLRNWCSTKNLTPQSTLKTHGVNLSHLNNTSKRISVSPNKTPNSSTPTLTKFKSIINYNVLTPKSKKTLCFTPNSKSNCNITTSQYSQASKENIDISKSYKKCIDSFTQALDSLCERRKGEQKLVHEVPQAIQMTPSKGMPSPRQETGKFIFTHNNKLAELEKREKQQKLTYKENQNHPYLMNSKSAKVLNTEKKEWEPMKNIINCMNTQTTVSTPRNPDSSSRNTESTPTKKDPISEKKALDNKLLFYSKANDTKKCLELLSVLNKAMKPDVNFKSDTEWTALHYACLNGNHELVSLLIYEEADIEAETSSLLTPLMIACQKGFETIVQSLINAGSDINSRDCNKNTPLHYAVINGQKKIVELFLKKASVNILQKNLNGKSPYELAHIYPEILEVFENYLKANEEKEIEKKKIYIQKTKPKDVLTMFKKTESEEKCLVPNKPLSNIKFTPTKESNPPTPIKEEENATNLIKIGPQSFDVHGLLGKGSFGEVYLVEKKDTKQLFAMKVLHKSKIAKNNLIKYAMTERNVLSITNHPFIVKLNYAFQTEDKLFLLLDYCPGGDLGEHLQQEKKFPEDKCKYYISEIVLALEDLHKRDIIFRDLKPDNIVISSEGHALLTDFGLSKEGVLDPSQGARSFCGSVAYLAPEMLKRCGHGKAVDWYLLGVVMYEMLVGIPPYYANNRDQLFSNIEKAPLNIPSHVSRHAKSLLKGLLERNPSKRLGSGQGDADEIKAHPFFEELNWKDVYNKKLPVPKPEIKVKLNTKYCTNVFEPNVDGGEGQKINGWSFAIDIKPM